MTDYESVARPYARHRQARNPVVTELLRGGRPSPAGQVLEIGCGTGNHIAAVAERSGCLGCGVDPSGAMLRHAPSAEGLRFSRSGAERLPFEAGSFELAFSVDVIHHVTDTAGCFREARRVLAPGGRICTVTDSAEIIRNRRPLAELWPESVDADLGRYPPIATLREQMAHAGFVDIDERTVAWDVEIPSAEPYREKAFSCLQLISEEAFRRGLARLERALEAGAVQGRSAYACLWGRVPGAPPCARGR